MVGGKMKKRVTQNRVVPWIHIRMGLGNLLILVIAHAVYIFNTHYSEDSFEAMLNIGALANTNLRNGRVLHYLLYAFLNAVGFNILEHQRLTQILMTLVLTVGITVMAYRFVSLDEETDIKRYIVVDLTFLFIFLNPSFLFGWYYWPETCLGASVSLAVTFWAISMWCQKTMDWKHALFSFLLLCISISMYQVYIELYVGICLAYTLLKYSCEAKKRALLEYITVLIFGGVASVANIVLMALLQRMNLTYKDERSATLSKEVIINNIHTVWQNQSVIWWDMNGFLPDGYLGVLALVTVLAIITGICMKKRKIRCKDVFFFLLILVTVYGLAFVPNLISGTVWLAPRTYIGMFAFIQIGMLYALYYLKDIPRMEKCYVIFLIVFLFLMILRLLQLETNTIVSNRFDEYEIKTIGERITEYEENTGNYVDTVLFSYDENRSYKYDEVNYMAYDSNVRGMAYSWCFSNMMKYYIRQDLNVEEMQEEDYQKYFENQQWNEFRSEQQLQFEGNKLYIAIY